jgi:hypothetical protein
MTDAGGRNEIGGRMAHIRMRIEEIEYRSEDKSLLVLGVDDFQTIVTLEVRPVYPRQLAADLDFVARHPDARIVIDGPHPLPGDRN